MNRQETITLLQTITAEFPMWKMENPDVTVAVWHERLKGYEYAQVMNGYDKYVKTQGSGFAPSTAQIISHIQQPKEYPTPQEAWSRIHKGICNSGYHAKEEFDRLPPILQKCIGSAEEMHRLAYCESEYTLEQTKKACMRTYEKLVEEKQNQDKAKIETQEVKQLNG